MHFLCLMFIQQTSISTPFIYPTKEMIMQYQKTEDSLNKNLVALFDEWRTTLQDNGLAVADFVTDGFYPYYTMQKKKVLFIGRESLGLAGEDYISFLYPEYKQGCIGDTNINNCQFHALMLYHAWALNNNLPEWRNIPYASELASQFATEEGFSFAFMNLSKLSNESDSWQADWPLIDSFIKNSNHPTKNFFNEQIRILNPDIIITMNLEGRIEALGEHEYLADKSNGNVAYYNLFVDGNTIPLYDMFHFSAPGKSGESDYYLPLKKLLAE